MKINLILLISAMVIATVSCSKDHYSNPAGTISVNIMNEDNGKTMLGNSDIYINQANNFYGSTSLMNDLGRKKGLGSISKPILKGLSDQVAVEVGNAYQIFNRDNLREFPSGEKALKITANYYNIYVLSSITNNDNHSIGVKVDYSLMDVPTYGLPKYNSEIGTLHGQIRDQLIIKLQTSDFEYEPDDDYADFLEFRKDGNKLIVSLNMSVYSYSSFGIYIRISEGYTYVRGKITLS